MTTPQPKHLSDAQVGDTVILKGVVRSFDRIDKYGKDMIDVYFPGCAYSKGLMSFTEVELIIPKAWEPEVGKKCKYRSEFSGIVCLSPSYTIEAIVRDQLFVSFTRDGKTTAYTNFTKDQAVCAD